MGQTLSVFVNKALLPQSHAHLFLAAYTPHGSLEYLGQRLPSLQVIKYLLCGLLWEEACQLPL